MTHAQMRSAFPLGSVLLVIPAVLLWLSPIARGLVFEAELLPIWVAFALMGGAATVLGRPRLGIVRSMLPAGVLLAAFLFAVGIWQHPQMSEPSRLGLLGESVQALMVILVALLMAQIIAADVARRRWRLPAEVAAVVALLFVTTPLLVAVAVFGQIVLGGEWI